MQIVIDIDSESYEHIKAYKNEDVLPSGVDGECRQIIKEFAQVIEELSAKLQAANMERSSQYYNGGWIPVSERLPEEMGTYMTTIDYGEHGIATGQRYYYGKGLKWNDECVIAWQPHPEPYKAESEEKE